MKQNVQYSAVHKLSSLFITIVLVVLITPQTKAQDTSWYSDSETVFTLTTSDQLIGFRTLIKNGKKFDGKTVKLGNDIDVSSTNWTAIGSFTGTFDGCGHTITYSYNYDKNSCPTSNGLFGYTSNALIKNLKVTGVLSVQSNYNKYSIYCGGIVGRGTNTSIINCCNKVQIEYNRYSYNPDKYSSNYKDYVGGICGYSDGCEIYFCVNEASINCPWRYALEYTGGICGYASPSTSSITKCENLSDITGFTGNITSSMPGGSTYLGGIVGYGGTISYCRNTGNCMANNPGSVNIGGIAGLGGCKSCYVASEKITSNRTPKAITSSGTTNNCFANNDIVGVSISGTGVNFVYSLSQMKTVEFVNALNETAYMWVGGEGVLPVVLGSMNETEGYNTRPNPGTIALNMSDIDIPLESEMQLTATVLPEGAWQTVLWESSNPEIVSVTDNGLLTGNAVGNATITVTSTKDNSVTAICNVHVGTKDVKQIVLPENISVHYAEERQLEITVLPSYANMNLVYESADENVATIENGKIIGIGVGETVITVKDLLTGIQRNCNISVYLEVGDTFKADISNGTGTVSTTFAITDVKKKYASIGDGTNSSIEKTVTGDIVIPRTIVGLSNITYNVNTIADNAFKECKISSVTIPQETTSIGENAFNGCRSLTSVTVNWLEPISISSTCFSNAANATLHIPKSSYKNYANADNWNKFSKIIEPLHNDNEIFTASIICPYEMGNTMLIAKRNMTFMVIDAINKRVSVGNGEEASISDDTSGGVTIPSIVEGYDGETYWVKELSLGAFFGCDKVTSVDLPSGITTIGQASFYDCSSLSSFTIPTGVTTIEEDAFNGCSGLSSITIPYNVQSIGAGAFYRCNNLASVTMRRTEPIEIDAECFTNAKNATLNVPKGSYINYASADNWKNFKTIKEPAHSVGDTFTTSITVDGGSKDATFKVTNTSSKYVSIGDGEDAAIDIFTSGNVVIPSTVKGYDGQTYTVKTVADAAFFGCENMSSISLPSSITEIGNSAFFRCYHLANITIPAIVTKIGDEAFFYCEKLASISIPKNVTSIGTKAFKNCNMLTSVSVGWNTPIAIDSECFSNAANATLNVPYGAKERYEAATGWKQFKNIVEMTPKDGDMFTALTAEGIKMTFTIINANAKTCKVGDGINISVPTGTYGLVTIPSSVNGFTVTQIDYKAFYNCSKIAETVIPISISSIGSYAFSGCNNLTTVTVGWDNPISIGSNCFSNAANAVLYVPMGTEYEYNIATGWKEFGQIVNKTNNTLFAGDIEVCRGGQTILSINMTNDEKVRFFQFELSLPKGVSVVTNADGSPLVSLTQRATSKQRIQGSLLPNGNYQFFVSSMSDDVFSGTEGRVATVVLKVRLNVTPDEYNIGVVNAELNVEKDGEGQGLLVKDTYSKLNVNSILLGDANNDKRVSVSDISTIIDYILKKNPSKFVWCSANANGDERISVSDISTIIDIILRKSVFGETQATKKEELDPQ